LPPNLALSPRYCAILTARLKGEDDPFAETVTVLVPGGVLRPVDVVEETELPHAETVARTAVGSRSNAPRRSRFFLHRKTISVAPGITNSPAPASNFAWPPAGLVFGASSLACVATFVAIVNRVLCAACEGSYCASLQVCGYLHRHGSEEISTATGSFSVKTFASSTPKRKQDI
jgi:hypothetical protein